MDDIERFNRLVGLVYESVISPAAWTTALQEVADALGCDMFHAFIWNREELRPEVGWATASTRTMAMHAAYNGHYGRIDPRRLLADITPEGEVFRCHDHIDERAVSNSEFYQDFLLPNELRYMLGSTLRRTPGKELTLALLRGRGRAPFSEVDTALARRLVPHLQRATAIFLRLGHLSDLVNGTGHALERMEAGTAFLDEQGYVLWMNGVAEALLGPTTGLRIVGRRLSSFDPGSERALEDAWNRLRASGEPQEVLVSRKSSMAVTYCRAPKPHSSNPLDTGSATYWVFMTPLGRNHLPEASQLRALFGLTAAEARLALSLVSGHSLAESAASARVKLSTVRTQLLSVLAKTGARRQQDLVALLMRLPRT